MKIRSPNNFDAIRFIAASLVLFSHSFPLTLHGEKEPVAFLTNGFIDGGKIAVITFFILSGFLVSASWESKNNFRNYLSARIKRILPALIGVLLLTVLAGAILSTSSTPEYIPSAANYFAKNITLYKGQPEIIGVFESNPYGSAVNGSLWTLRHEFTCYLLIAGLGCLKLIQKNYLLLAWLVAALLPLVAPINSNFLFEFLPLCAWFLSGALTYSFRDHEISKASVCICVSAIIFTALSGANLVLASPAIAYLLIHTSYKSSPFLNFGKYGDFSYEIYIYAFPVQQLVIYLLHDSVSTELNPWLVSLYSFPITLILSIVSWNLIEKRFLNRKTI